MKKNKILNWKITLAAFLLIILLPVGYYSIALTPVGPLPEVLPFLKDTPDVQVISTTYLYFQPQTNPTTTGMIIYPGGRVDYRSYAPLARMLAEKGWPVAVVQMPLNLAVLAPDKANEVIKDHPEVTRWVIAGHSLGGSMASQFAVKNPGVIHGIIFLAAYPVNDKLQSSDIETLSIFASEDGLIPPFEWDTYRSRFPANTRWVEIQGGNHAGFGWYGAQNGDHPAAISLADQTNQVFEAIDRFLGRVSNNSQ